MSRNAGDQDAKELLSEDKIFVLCSIDIQIWQESNVGNPSIE
jgi:hypothetical protein